MRAWTPPAAVALAVALGALVAAPAAGATTSPGLTSDASGPLFTTGPLAPGAPLERCVLLTWSAAAGTSLGVSAAITGDLAPFLDVTVQAGRGGGYGGCGDFVGTAPAWTGDLASLSGEHGAPERQAPLLPVPTAAGSATVRITVSVRDDDRAQARRAGGDIVFALVPVGAAPSPEPAGPTATPDRGTSRATPTAAPRAGGTSDDDRTAAPTPGPTDAPTTTPTTGPTAPPVPQDDATVTVPLSPGPPTGGAAGTAGTGLAAAVQALLEDAGRAAGAVTRAVGWTFWSAPIILLFLLVQNRIDARDPKLAQAPAQAVPGLPFDERYDAVVTALGVPGPTSGPAVPR